MRDQRQAEFRARLDLAGAGVVTVLFGGAMVNYDGLGRVATAIDHIDATWLRAVLSVCFILPLAATWFATRRWLAAADVHDVLLGQSGLDPLTGLPDRLRLASWIEEALESGEDTPGQVAVLFIDLDKFKAVNDTYGHEVGDRLMMQVANRLRASLRTTDRLVRYGGDEFVAIAPGIPNQSAIVRIAQTIIDALETPFEVGRDVLRISCSVGIALSEDNDESADDILRDADRAMYEAKSERSGQYRIVERLTRDQATRMTTEARLVEAITGNELVVYHQPIFDASTRSLVGAEALIRWEDPRRGLVSPASFVPMLEETGLIIDAGLVVLDLACRDALGWPMLADGSMPSVNVNVAARQLAQAGFAPAVIKALDMHHLPPERLCLEITESALLWDITTAWSSLRQLKDRGVRLALDDFGTGYSSLTHLRELLLDIVKIDRSFVMNLGTSAEDSAIVRHVIAMANELGVEVVAEGVETDEQADLLTEMGCSKLQGFLLGRPMPATDFETFIHDAASAAQPVR